VFQRGKTESSEMAATTTSLKKKRRGICLVVRSSQHAPGCPGSFFKPQDEQVAL
jgi:hypothetical protein